MKEMFLNIVNCLFEELFNDVKEIGYIPMSPSMCRHSNMETTCCEESRHMRSKFSTTCEESKA